MELKKIKLACTLSAMAILALLCLPGCSKKTEPVSSEETKTEQITAEKEFLSAADAAVCYLKTTTVSKLHLDRPPAFVQRMEQDNRETLKQGTITLDGRKYDVLLGDKTSREFNVFDVEGKYAPYWWGSWSLHSTHLLGGKFYEFMLIEDGNKLAGRRYTGEFGTFKLGKGNRELEEINMSGSLSQAGYRSAPIGTISKRRVDKVTECSIPVGDYTLYLMSIKYDNLRISVSRSYYNNTGGRRSTSNIVYGMLVRKEKPYVLDFSNEPAIIFESPNKKNVSFDLGAEIKIAAVLIDPKLDIMIRGLDDTSVKVEKETKDDNGNVVRTRMVDKSLDPTVVITRSDGEIVADGIMPFG